MGDVSMYDTLWFRARRPDGPNRRGRDGVSSGQLAQRSRPLAVHCSSGTLLPKIPKRIERRSQSCHLPGWSSRRQEESQGDGTTGGVTMNAIRAIYPFRHEGLLVFDDETVGLPQEPFVSGAHGILDRLPPESSRPLMNPRMV